MRILLFHAATAAAATTAMTKLANQLRAEGNKVGERFLPAFKSEKEPTDVLAVALTGAEAGQYSDRLVELGQAFGVTEDNHETLVRKLQLPDSQAELEDFDFDAAVKSIVGDDGDSAVGSLTVEQAKAEAIERGLEVGPDTTPLQLEQMLGLSVSEAGQADARAADAVNNENRGEPRIGVRVSQTMPTVNGLDLARQSDDQLRATAANMGLKVPDGMRRSTIITKLTQLMAAKVDAPAPNPGRTPSAATEAGNSTLPSESTQLPDVSTMRTHAELDETAKQEGVDLGDASTVEQKRDAIVAARTEGSNG